MAGRDPEERVVTPLIRQDWRLTAFLHWRSDPEDIRPLLPPGLRPDLVDGSAWITLTPFRVERFRVLSAPPLPRVSSFPETNVRTYVRNDDGRDGLWFFSLDVGSASNALAGRAIGAPYFVSAMSVRETDTVRYRSRRLIGGPASHDIVLRPGPSVAEDDEVAAQLTGRWRAFTRVGPKLMEVAVQHEPWPLRHASLEQLHETVLTAASLSSADGEPLVHFADAVSARIARPRGPRRTATPGW